MFRNDQKDKFLGDRSINLKLYFFISLVKECWGRTIKTTQIYIISIFLYKRSQMIDKNLVLTELIFRPTLTIWRATNREGKKPIRTSVTKSLTYAAKLYPTARFPTENIEGKFTGCGFVFIEAFVKIF